MPSRFGEGTRVLPIAMRVVSTQWSLTARAHYTRSVREKSALFVIGVLVLSSCVDRTVSRVAFSAPAAAPELPAPPPLTNDGQVIFVTLDGVRAEDVFDGASPMLKPGVDVHEWAKPEWIMPHLYDLAATRGVALGADRPGCGTVRTGTGVNVSLPGYTSMFTGHPTECANNRCAAVLMPTVLDEAVANGVSAASIGSWEVLARAVSNGASGVFVSEGTARFPGLRPLEDVTLEGYVSAGERADPYPGDHRYRPDALTMLIALRYLHDAHPAVFHVGLGDADEWGHRNDYASYLAAIRAEDAFIGQLAETIDDKTTVIVTTDHGRNEDFKDHGAASPSAARSWVMAFGARVAPQGITCGRRDITLADLAPTIRVLVGLPPDHTRGAGRPIEELLPPPR